MGSRNGRVIEKRRRDDRHMVSTRIVMANGTGWSANLLHSTIDKGRICKMMF
jgi:hypothetical protein